LGVLNLTTAIVMALNLWDVKIRGKVDINIKIGIIFLSFLYVYAYVTGGVNNTAFVWYFTYPLIACYLLGSRGGVFHRY